MLKPSTGFGPRRRRALIWLPWSEETIRRRFSRKSIALGCRSSAPLIAEDHEREWDGRVLRVVRPGGIRSSGREREVHLWRRKNAPLCRPLTQGGLQINHAR